MHDQPREPLREALNRDEAEILVDIIEEHLNQFSERTGNKTPSYLVGLDLTNRIRKAFGMIPFKRSW